LLENVRNISGPRHQHEWKIIVKTLRQLGYRVSSIPLVVSPHKIHPDFGGRPQVRERVFIAATKTGKNGSPFGQDPGLPDLNKFEVSWNHQSWNLHKDLPLEKKLIGSEKAQSKLSKNELEWINAWADFIDLYRRENGTKKLPGFPLWVDHWVLPKNLNIPRNTPKWKEIFLKKNAEFYKENKILIDKWLKKYDRLKTFPPSRRKFEWQAQDTKSLLDTIMHFRPSGIRAKKATYVPALVAITQTTILGKHKRRLTVREGARLQGLPEWFDFLDQSTAQSFKQLGNGVNIGVVYNVVKAQVLRDLELLEKDSDLVKSILQAPNSPDEYLSKFHIPEKTKKESKGKMGNSLRSISSA